MEKGNSKTIAARLPLNKHKTKKQLALLLYMYA